MEAGEKNRRMFAKVQTEDVFCFSYTSGTTGQPKGALITHGNILANIAHVFNSEMG